jgi:hypothetical protein
MRRLLAVLLATLTAAAPAAASPDVRTGISDDAILLSDPLGAPAAVAAWKAAGVDSVRVQVRWVAVAPDPLSPAMPFGFDPTNPDDPGYNWEYLDRAIALVRLNGLEPILAVTGSGPLWSSSVPSLGNPRYQPDAVKFGQFARAVARRYGDVATKYLIWNEPNQPLWLQPQQECPAPGARCTPVAPHTYRELVRAAYPAIKGADPTAQVIAGTLAPRGADPFQRNRPLRPLAFLRAFGCVDDRYKPVRTGRCSNFRPARIDGFAVHPHAIKSSPVEPSPRSDDANFADLPKVEAALDAVQKAHGFTTPTGAKVPLHLTEFGYQTNPPDTYDGIPPARQDRYLQWAAYLAWKDPRVRTVVQYAWQDERVRRAGGGRKQFSGWQSGLLFANGRPKPALGGFRNPFHADTTIAAPKVRFWGQVRPGTTHRVQLQKAGASGGFVTVATLSTDTRGTWTLTKLVAKRGTYRYRYADELGRWVYSDPLTVTPAAKPSPARRGPTSPPPGRSSRPSTP